MSNAASLVILLPWFGPWPFWMPAFLASCRCNTRVRWELFGDHPLPWTLPANVSLHEIAFPDYCGACKPREEVWRFDEQALSDGRYMTPDGFFPLKDKVPA